MADVVHLMPLPTRQEWMAQAVCAGLTHDFFPPHGEQADARAIREARAAEICGACPVILECRDHARLHREQGFWGGENDEQRIEHRRRANGGRLPVPAHRTAASG